MYSAEDVLKAKEQAKRTKRSISSFLPGAEYGTRKHRRIFGVQPQPHAPVSLAGPSNTSQEDDISTTSYVYSNSGSKFGLGSSSELPPRLPSPFQLPDSPPNTHRQPMKPNETTSTLPAASAHSDSDSDSGCSAVPQLGLYSRSQSPSVSWYPELTGCSRSSSPTRHSDSLSDEEDPHLISGDAEADVDFFGRYLEFLSISGVNKPPHLFFDTESVQDNWDDDDDSSDDNDNGGDGPQDEEGDPDPDDPDAQADGPQIQVPPDDPGDMPGDPGDDNRPFNFPAMDEDPTLRNIYLRTWVLYAFKGVTQQVIQAVLESHKSTLLANAHLYDPEFIAQVQNMPTTLHSLERRLGMDFSDLITVYPLCPECGKRYTLEELDALHGPQCTRHVDADRCSGELYTKSMLADNTQKRTPKKSFPYNSLPAAIGRLLSHAGIAELAQHWQHDNPNNAPGPLDNPPQPVLPEVWFNNIEPDTRFGDISEGWGWHAQATGMTRHYDLEEHEYRDEATGDAALSLARLPLGLNLGLNLDGFQAFQGKFAAGGSYSANGVYIIINNLPFFQRNLIENMILAMVIPGPHEPKGYAFEQMLEPLIDDLVALADGVQIPVYNSETGQIEDQLVYANLSVLIVDWIARIKFLGHVGVAAEENHCLYCKIRQCQLSVAEGYQLDDNLLRDPHAHLQDKHRGLRAPVQERENIRLETGTSFTEFDRVPGFFAFDNAPIDIMHLLDLGLTATITRDIISKRGMLQRRHPRQAAEDTPEARFNAFMAKTVYPHGFNWLPTKIGKMGSRIKAEQWRLSCAVLVGACFNAWRVGDTIPDGDIPRGGRNTKHFKAQNKSANLLLRRRRQVHIMHERNPKDRPQIEDCIPSRNPRNYFANVLRFCVGSTYLTQHRVTLAEVDQGAALMEQVGMAFTEMNVHLPPSFHAAIHLADHTKKYGSVYNTLTARFERANRLLGNVNTNGHGHGVLEVTMAKAFLRRTECHRYVHKLQSIEEPSANDIKTIEVLLKAMKNGPEHEVQRGMLEAVLAGEVPMHGQEEIRMATTSAQVNFVRDAQHRDYYDPLHDVRFYGLGLPPDDGELQVHIPRINSTISYPHFHRYGVRYGSANHYRGLKSRYGFLLDQVPVIIQGIYETMVVVRGQEYKFQAVMVQRFVAPAEHPPFPWNHWNRILAIGVWVYGELAPLKVVLPSAFTGVFALSDIEMPYGHFWLTFAMINMRPEDLAGNN